MFNYSPTVNDRSGEIIAAGTVGAAQANQQAMQGMGDNIGNALQMIGAAYGEHESMKAKGRAFKDTMKVLGPLAGINTDTLAAVAGKEGGLKNDMDWYHAREAIMPVMPSLFNSKLYETKSAQSDKTNQAYMDRMYESERMRRERDAINNPPPPQPMALPPSIRRFNTAPSATPGS